jgi:hypothetical protein
MFGRLAAEKNRDAQFFFHRVLGEVACSNGVIRQRETAVKRLSFRAQRRFYLRTIA